jgi:hypothetical protein
VIADPTPVDLLILVGRQGERAHLRARPVLRQERAATPGTNAPYG